MLVLKVCGSLHKFNKIKVCWRRRRGDQFEILYQNNCHGEVIIGVKGLVQKMWSNMAVSPNREGGHG